LRLRESEAACPGGQGRTVRDAKTERVPHELRSKLERARRARLDPLRKTAAAHSSLREERRGTLRRHDRLTTVDQG
jgi:hypothetical protein